MKGGRQLDSLPSGWYRLGTRRELGPSTVVPVEGLGMDVVGWVLADGTLRAARAHCPHLGAHLGHGGCVDGDELQCGFHGWAYGRDGANRRSTADGPAVPAARLEVLPTRWADDVGYVFHDAGTGRPPWEPAEFPEVANGPPDEVIEGTERLTAHQQVVLEGDFDAAHFGPVHDQRFRQEAAAFEGPGASVSYRSEGRRPQTIEIRLDGLTRMWQRMTIGRVVVGVRADYRSTDPAMCQVATHVAVWAPTARIAARTVGRMRRVLERDIARDARIWEHRDYTRPAALTPADDAIGRFRAWASTFYPAGNSPADPG